MDATSTLLVVKAGTMFGIAGAITFVPITFILGLMFRKLV